VQQDLPVPHVPMCSDCNGLLNRYLEEPAKPVIRKILPWSAEHEWPVITAPEAAAVGRWLLKIAVLWAHPEADDDNPRVTQGPNIGKFDFAEPEWLSWMSEGRDPPCGFTVYVCRRDPLSDRVPWTGRVHRIELPMSATVDDREVRYMKREIGIKGLDATGMWHPGWHIEHPLVAEGRAAALWPNPTAIDFAALGEVRQGECSIVIGATGTDGPT
jgi:hypothetical protein